MERIWQLPFSSVNFVQDPIEISVLFANSRTVNRRPFRIFFSQIVATPSFLDDVDGLPERGSSSANRRLYLKRIKHSKVTEPLNESSPKSGFNRFRCIVFTKFQAKLDATRVVR